STPLLDQERLNEVKQETEDLAVEPKANLKKDLILYTVDTRDLMAVQPSVPLTKARTGGTHTYAAPLSEKDLEDFITYAWTRAHMGNANTVEDTTGFRCPAAYSWCRDCYRDRVTCDDGKNAIKYWTKYAGSEPQYWKNAALRILNGRRSTTSPMYAPCPDDWRDVLKQTYATLHPTAEADP